MAGLQQFYFFPTDFLDTIKDHPSLPLAAKEDDDKPRKTILVLQDSVQKLNDDYKKVKISSDTLPRRVVSLNKQKKKPDV
ncbi:hypothetical protein L1987_29412 [Smallanthus sonchifolius]|uniref:Uncharacterized protein n=1 Tax=Smallanthus sonchifolius TaxID=185202 RepID=A0ACB9HZB6_9ASTR|nr:hypothetical protein L1987_29412 [Smallanthus sonchifolius]